MSSTDFFVGVDDFNQDHCVRVCDVASITCDTYGETHYVKVHATGATLAAARFETKRAAQEFFDAAVKATARIEIKRTQKMKAKPR